MRRALREGLGLVLAWLGVQAMMDLICVEVEERDENGFLLAMKESGDLSVDAWPYAKPRGDEAVRQDEDRESSRRCSRAAAVKRAKGSSEKQPRHDLAKPELIAACFPAARRSQGGVKIFRRDA